MFKLMSSPLLISLLVSFSVVQAHVLESEKHGLFDISAQHLSSSKERGDKSLSKSTTAMIFDPKKKRGDLNAPVNIDKIEIRPASPYGKPSNLSHVHHGLPAGKTEPDQLLLPSVDGWRKRDVVWYKGEAYIGDVRLGTPEQISRALETKAVMYRPWPTNQIPFVIQNETWPAEIQAEMQRRIYAAIEDFERNTDFQFIELPAHFMFVPEWLVFEFGHEEEQICTAPPGYEWLSGGQSILLSSACTTGTIIHEIGHALGLQHQFVRADRDQYLTINEPRIAEGKEYLFDLSFLWLPGGTESTIPFSFDSIMMYWPYAFTGDNWPTISRKDSIGGPTMAYLYPEDPEQPWQQDEQGLYTINTQMYQQWREAPFSIATMDISQLLVGDFDGNGIDDIVHPQQGVISYDGVNEWEPFNNDAWRLYNYHGYELRVGDFDNNGIDDVLVANGRLLRISPNGTGRLAMLFDTQSTTAIPRNIKVADFNGDGSDDIFWSSNDGWKVIYPNVRDEFGGLLVETISESNISASEIRLGDFDCDSQAEILYASGEQWLIKYDQEEDWIAITDSHESLEKVRIGQFDGQCADDIAMVVDDELRFLLMSAEAQGIWGAAKQTITRKFDINRSIMGRFDHEFIHGFMFEGYFELQNERLDQSDIETLEWYYEQYR